MLDGPAPYLEWPPRHLSSPDRNIVRATAACRYPEDSASNWNLLPGPGDILRQVTWLGKSTCTPSRANQRSNLPAEFRKQVCRGLCPNTWQGPALEQCTTLPVSSSCHAATWARSRNACSRRAPMTLHADITRPGPCSKQADQAGLEDKRDSQQCPLPG